MIKPLFLTARWTDLVLLNFVVPADLIAQVAPPGTEPDLHEGVAYISIVGFRFQDVRVLGLSIPRHTRFDEINLRYYVKRVVDNETRRGVVFVREIVPRLAVAMLANGLYHEKYVTRPMRSTITMQGTELAPGDTLEYAWRSRNRTWNFVAAEVAAPLSMPSSGSVEEFIVEHYWGYNHGRDGRTREYRVAHPTWRVAPATNIRWDCDLLATYAPPFAEYLSGPPASALIAEGSAVQVYRGNCV